MLDFRIETFLTVCKHLNFTKAAAELNVTQPAVSHHIHFLEKKYGVPLFTYEKKKVQITPAGKILCDASLTMKHDESYIKRCMVQASGKVKTYLFGATLSVAEFIIAENLGDFILRHPDSSINMQVADTKELLEKLNSGELDFVLIEGNFPKPDYDYFIYGVEEYIAAARWDKADHYSGKSLTALFDEPLLIREQGSGTREILEEYLKSNGLTISCFSHRTEIGNIGTIKSLLKRGYGVSFLYRVAIKKEEQSGILKQIKLNDFKLTHEISFVFRKNSIFKQDYENVFKELRFDTGSDKRNTHQ